MRSARTGSTSAKARHRYSSRPATAVTSSVSEPWAANGARWRKHRIDGCRRAISCRPPATVVFGKDGADQPAKTFGLLVVQIAGQAERMAAGVDEMLQRVGALDGVADHRDPGARPDFCDTGPQMRQQEIAMLAGELLHTLVGGRIVVERLDLLLLPFGRVAHQY